MFAFSITKVHFVPWKESSTLLRKLILTPKDGSLRTRTLISDTGQIHKQTFPRKEKPTITSQVTDDNSIVYCLHGFLSHRLICSPAASYLSRSGRKVFNYGYSSRSYTLQDHAMALADQVASSVETHKPDRVHFVTHSMGGLVLKAAMNCKDFVQPAKRGRCVLIAPPLKGAALAAIVASLPYPLGSLATWVIGDFAGTQLRSTPYDGFKQIGEFPSSVSLLIVAGDAGRINPLLPRTNDGVICLDETWEDRPHYRHTVRLTHNLLMFSPQVLASTRDFILKQGIWHDAD